MKLSILLPSKRPVELENFIQSLKKNSYDFDSIELVILRDLAGWGHMSWKDGNIIYVNDKYTPYASERMYECFSHATGDWIMFGNDDLVCETKNWDLILKELIDNLEDNPVLIYINDKLFEGTFPCFPVVSRKLLEVSRFFPLPKYKMYKVDDTLMSIVPTMIYVPDIVMKHLNTGEQGFPVNGKVYNVDDECALHDTLVWNDSVAQREEMKRRVDTLWHQK